MPVHHRYRCDLGDVPVLESNGYLNDNVHPLNVSEADSAPAPDPENQLDVQFWYRRVYALCQSRLRIAADAEDATQETFLRGYSQLGELRDSKAFGGWLRTIASNVCVDFVRRQSVRKATDADLHPIVDDNTHCTDDHNAMVRKLVQELPEPLAEIVLLHYYDEMTYDQMAEWLGVARSTVNERLSKARALLRRQLTSTEGAR